MSQIRFDIKHKEAIDNGDLEVRTIGGALVDILSYNNTTNPDFPIHAQVFYPGRGDIRYDYNLEGIRQGCGKDKSLNLVLYDKGIDKVIHEWSQWFLDHEYWDGDYNTCVKLNHTEFLAIVEKIYNDIKGNV